MVKKPNAREAIIYLLRENRMLTKYKIAKDIKLASRTQINRYIDGTTKRMGYEHAIALYDNYGVLIPEAEENYVQESGEGALFQEALEPKKEEKTKRKKRRKDEKISKRTRRTK